MTVIEPIRPRYVLDSANLWVSPGPIFEDANSSDAREKKAAVDDDVDGGFFFSSRVVAALRRLRKREDVYEQLSRATV